MSIRGDELVPSSDAGEDGIGVVTPRTSSIHQNRECAQMSVEVGSVVCPSGMSDKAHPEPRKRVVIQPWRVDVGEAPNLFRHDGLGGGDGILTENRPRELDVLPMVEHRRLKRPLSVWHHPDDTSRRRGTPPQRRTPT